MKKLLLILLFILSLFCYPTSGEAASNFYGATSLIGSATGSLDSIDGTNLATGDGAYVITSTAFYIYYLDAASGAAESSPDVISPDSNAENKRWLLMFEGTPDMADVAQLAVTDGNFIVGNGTTWVAESGATARTSMGVGTTDSPTFVTTKLSGLTDTYIPYHVADATGLADSPLSRTGAAAVTMTGTLTSTVGMVTPAITAPAASLVIKPTTDATTAIQMQDKDGNAIVTVDTVGNKAIVAGPVITATTTLSAAGPTDNLDVSGVNTVLVNTSANSVTLGGLVGGVAGQQLRIVIINATNNTTLENAEVHANQQIYLEAAADETKTATYGGWILECNGTHWYQTGGGGGGAPTDATYITQTANGDLSAEQALGALATGIVKNTTTTGVLSIAAAGTDYVAPDAELTALAGLTFADDQFILGTGAGTVGMASCTVFAQNILDDSDEATFKQTVNLEIGTDVQAYSAALQSIAGLTETNGGIPYGTADNIYAWLAAGDTGKMIIAKGAAAPEWTPYTFPATVPTVGKVLISDGTNLIGSTALGTAAYSATGDFQAAHAYLSDIAGITANQGDIIYFNGTDWVDLGPGDSGKYLKTQGADANPMWDTPVGSGDVSKVGTPADNQVGVWTGDGTIEGAASLTYDGSNFQLTGDIGATGTRITKGWFTDLTVTNAIAGSVTGNAVTVTITDDESTDDAHEVVFTTDNSNLESDGTFTYNPSTGVVTSTGFAGALTGNVTGDASGSSGSCTGNSATATLASTVTVTDDESTDDAHELVFTTDNSNLESDGTATYNPSTGIITATGFAGALTGNVTGDVSGSSGSCTGQAATVATIAGLAPNTATTQATQPNITSCAALPWTGLKDGTDGEIPTFDADGHPAFVAVGTATHVLTSNGPGAAPTFQAAAGGAFDSTTVDSTTWSDGANATNIWTFDVSGTDTTLTFGSGQATYSGILIDTHYETIYIPAASMSPTSTSGAVLGSYEYATNDIQADYLGFNGATEQYATFMMPFPAGWDRSTVKVKFYWTSATGSTAGDTVEWEIAGGALSDDDAIDAALGTAQVISDVLLADSGADMQTSGATPALTVGGTPALGDMLVWKVSRNVGGTDDMTEDSWLFGALIQYKVTNAEAAW